MLTTKLGWSEQVFSHPQRNSPTKWWCFCSSRIPMAEKDQTSPTQKTQAIIQEDHENPRTRLLPPRIFPASKEKKHNQPTNQQCGWCSTNTLLLIWENGHPGCSFARLYTYILTGLKRIHLDIGILRITSKKRTNPTQTNPTNPTNQKCWVNVGEGSACCIFNKPNIINPPNPTNQLKEAPSRHSSDYSTMSSRLREWLHASPGSRPVPSSRHPRGVFVGRSERVGNRFREGEIPGVCFAWSQSLKVG